LVQAILVQGITVALPAAVSELSVQVQTSHPVHTAMSRVLALAAVALKSAEGGAAGVLRGTASSSQEPTPVPLPVIESWGEEQPAWASPQSGRRVDLFNSINGDATGSDTARTQRWVGAQPTGDNMFVSDINCTYQVPLDSDVDMTPSRSDDSCKQAHYIYCQMDRLDWPKTDQGHPGFSQFVPQLMRGWVVSGYHASDYSVRSDFLDTWAIQAQYYFEPVKGEGTKAYTGDLIDVSPGDTVYTRMYFGQSSSGKYGYTLQVWTDESRKSSITITVPFMGLAPGVTAEYGTPGAADLALQYYQLRASALHEAWCMDDPGYYPRRQVWTMLYEASQGQRVDEQPWNSCCDHSQDPCVPCAGGDVMRPDVLRNEAGVAALAVYRSGAGEQ